MDDLHPLTSLEELAIWLERSRERPVWIFKHSSRCGISDSARREFERFVASRPEAERGSFGLIEVRRARPVSEELARRTGVRHETPQVLLIDDGEVVWHASHWRIRGERLRSAAAGDAVARAGVG